jgi:hypothetical protein
VVLRERFPGFGLRGLHPGQYILREKCPRPVVACIVTFGIKPAVVGEVLTDLGLEADFFMQAHIDVFRVNLETISRGLPITAL